MSKSEGESMDIKSVVDRVPKLSRGRVWCKNCGRSEAVDSSIAMRYGWPKCCNQTMTIDSPEERGV